MDIDGDGHPDLTLAGFNSPNLVYLNNGTSSPFKNTKITAIGTGDTAYTPALGDINGDGFPDMVVSNTNHIPSRLYLTKGEPLTSGNYSTLQIGTDLGYGQDARIADVNGDGRPDIILSYVSAETNSADPIGISIYLNNGTSDPFNNVVPVRLLNQKALVSVNAITIADLNGDGKPDLIALVYDLLLNQSYSYVFLNTGSSSKPFASPMLLQSNGDLGGGCVGIAVADVDGDGFPDIALSCVAPAADASPMPAHPSVGSIYLNNHSANPFGNVAPSDIPASTSGEYGRSVAVGTLVKNGRPDVLIVDGLGFGHYHTTFLDQNPVAQNDIVTTAIDKAADINVLLNDAAAPGESLSASSVAITMAPQHGTAIVNSATGFITYSPNAGYTGSDTLRYTVQDTVGGLSNAASVVVSVQPVLPTPVFFPPGGTYNTSLSVAIGDSVPSAIIYYTLDGTTPTTVSATYISPLAVGKTTTIRALAVATGYAPSSIVSQTYTITASPSTAVPLASVANVNAIASTGSAVTAGGLDRSGDAYAADLLGNSVTWSGTTFLLGSAGGLDSVSSATINFTPGQYATLKFLGTAESGSQVDQTFTVTYTDGTADNYTQSMSDWKTPQGYAGEGKAVTMAYRVTASGSTHTGPYYLYGYSLTLNVAKTVKSLTLPNNRKVVVLAVSLAGGTATTAIPVAFGAAANVYAIFQDGTTVKHGGLDGGGTAASGMLLGTSLSWGGAAFTLGATNVADAISNTVLALPTARFSTLKLVATGVNGNQVSQAFTVTYTDGTSTSVNQSLSDWHSPQVYAGESTAATLAYKLRANGSQKTGPYYLFGYSFNLDPSKSVKTLTLPPSRNVVVLSAILQP